MVNEYVLYLFFKKEKIYLSYDSLYSPNSYNDLVGNIHTPLMLLKNIDQYLELCNKTRLVTIKMGKYVVEGKVISRSNIRDKVFTPRLSLTPSDVKICFKS